jgi:hypothetical protein
VLVRLARLTSVLFLFAVVAGDLAPADSQTRQAPQKYVGTWQGVSGSMSLKETELTGTAVIKTDIGSEITSYTFSVGADGKITGRGTAICWFDVTVDADLVALKQLKQKYEAHLEGGRPSFEFDIEGEMTPDGRVNLVSTSRQRLTLINAGKRNRDWLPFNVFGPGSHPVQEQGCWYVLDVTQALPRGRRERAINVAWKAQKVTSDRCGKLAEEIAYIEQNYLPFVEFAMEKYEQASNDPNVWRNLNADQAQDAVLRQIQERYPNAGVAGVTRTNADGSVTSTVYAVQEQYPWVITFREAHEKYFRDTHRQDQQQFASLPYPEYVQWSLKHNRDAYEVNKRLANERLARLKRECRQNCAGGCCGR